MTTLINNKLVSGLCALISLMSYASALPAVVVNDGLAFKTYKNCTEYLRSHYKISESYGCITISDKTQIEVEYIQSQYLNSKRAVRVQKGQKVELLNNQVEKRGDEGTLYIVKDWRYEGFTSIALIMIKDKKYYMPEYNVARSSK